MPYIWIPYGLNIATQVLIHHQRYYKDHINVNQNSNTFLDKSSFNTHYTVDKQAHLLQPRYAQFVSRRVRVGRNGSAGIMQISIPQVNWMATM